MERWIDYYVQGLSPAEYHLQLLLLCIFIGFILFKTITTYQRFRYIGDTPTSRIASAAQGYVELKGWGEMMPGLTITSPFSQRRCLWYQCIVEKRQRLRNHNVWVEESNEVSDHLFYLQDESGSTVIDPDGAHVIPSSKKTWFGSHPQARLQGGLKNSWLNTHLGFGRYRFTEKLISVADPLYVIGMFTTSQKNIDPDTLHGQVEALVKQWKTNPAYYLKSFDQDNNGKIQKQEWLKIRRHAENSILEQRGQTVHHLMQKPRESNQPYVISTRSEEQLLKGKQRLLLTYIVLFFFLLYVLLLVVK